MEGVQLSFKPKYELSERMRIMLRRYQEQVLSGKRKANGNGELRSTINIGPFPDMENVPSRKQRYRMDALQWAEDYAFLLDAMKPHIYTEETIVGEVYWEMGDIRPYGSDTAPGARELAEARGRLEKMGGWTWSGAHTCPDLNIPLTQGYGAILSRIRQYKDMYEQLKNRRRYQYLCAMETVCLACIRFIERYAQLAEDCAREAQNAEEKARFSKIAAACTKIAHQAPDSFYEAVLGLNFAVLFDKVIRGGNGYGRIDQYLIAFYQKGAADGSLDRRTARELVAELYLKLAGCFWSVGGRGQDGQDMTNEMSWIVLEAYDLIGTDCNLGVMWHSDMDPEYYDYACDVLARHGQATPVLINWDVMYASELRSGIPEKDAWKVTYAGCQWFSIPGMEYCGHDMSTVHAVMIMERALKRGLSEKVTDFEQLYAMFEEEIHQTMRLMQEAGALEDRIRGELWPEILTSMFSHGPIERGLDITAPRGVDYQYTSFNIVGIPNVTDSLTAVRRLIFEKQQYTLEEVLQACETDWADAEIMRQRFLNQPKYGNNITESDEMYVRICDSFQEIAEGYVNQRGGQPFRPCLYCYMGHMANEKNAATPDGRRKGDPYSHGINPQAGASKKGLLPMVNSASAADMRKFQGGSIQVELQPKFFDGKEEHYAYIRDFSNAFFKSGGMHLNINIMDLKKLEDAMEHPDKEEYRQLMVRVTGFSALFIGLEPAYQKDFISRANYAGIN